MVETQVTEVADTPQCSRICILNDHRRIAITEMTLQESSVDSGLFVTDARYLMRGAAMGSFATVESGTGSLYASRITVSSHPEELAAWDAEISSQLDQINADQRALCAQLAGDLGGSGMGWRLATCDLEGGELVLAGRALRLSFPEPLHSVYQIPEALQRIATDCAKSR
jgi:hypothetical protein